jgi:ATP-dependent RNA helicase DeaD
MEQLNFKDLGLSKEIMKAIEEMGFEEASHIQAKAIPEALKGNDIIGQSQTGTGKTAAFGIPILERINGDSKKLQSVILCPTRELAVQVSEEIKRLSKHKRGVNVLPIYGGQSIDRQIQALKRGVQIVIGTPGRVLDHINRGTIKMDTVNMVVLDEADEMLDMGFIEDIESILKNTPETRQTILFSATLPPDILKITKRYQKDPVEVKVVHKNLTVPSIEQFYYEVKEKAKSEVLSRLIDIHNPKLSLVFCNTKRRVDELVEQLQARGYSADALHGDLKQAQRDRVMNKFRNGLVEILVATDVAARGIDVDDVEIVFNFDVPQDEEYYVHRIGRTGRAGRTGKAFTFVVGRDIFKLRDIMRYANTKIILQAVPTASDVEEIKSTLFIEKIKNTIEEGHLSNFTRMIEGMLDDDISSLDIAAALLKMTMGDNSKKEVDQQQQRQSEPDAYYENTGAKESGMARLFINIGKAQGIGVRDIVGAIAGETGLSGKLIGTIDVYDKYTFVEIPREYASDVISVMKNNQIKGKKINIEPANSRS